jgi:hypothetical protein
MTDDYLDEIPFPPTQGNIRQPGLVEHNARVKAQREADCANPKRAITTEEAERLAKAYGGFWGLRDVAAALRSLAAERDALQAEKARLREAALDALAGLVAAHSLLKAGGKKAAPSDKMFAQMLSDYDAAITRTRAALGETQ